MGDCCIYQVRDDRLIGTFPVRRSADFGNTPSLIASRPSRSLPLLKRRNGKWKPGDRFFLMTDAVAEWFLRRHEERQMPWQSLLRRWKEPDPVAALTAYVKQLRQNKEMNNDDVTVLVIEL